MFEFLRMLGVCRAAQCSPARHSAQAQPTQPQQRVPAHSMSCFAQHHTQFKSRRYQFWGAKQSTKLRLCFFLPTKQHQFPGLDGAKIDDCFVIHVQYLNVLSWVQFLIKVLYYLAHKKQTLAFSEKFWWRNKARNSGCVFFTNQTTPISRSRWSKNRRLFCYTYAAFECFREI